MLRLSVLDQSTSGRSVTGYFVPRESGARKALGGAALFPVIAALSTITSQSQAGTAPEILISAIASSIEPTRPINRLV